ncbi:hypothetical protein EV122DRAFT_275579 [Schizophyllum commune]
MVFLAPKSVPDGVLPLSQLFGGCLTKDLMPVIIAHNHQAQAIMDSMDIPWGIQYELAHASAPSRHRAPGPRVCSRRPPPGVARVSDVSQVTDEKVPPPSSGPVRRGVRRDAFDPSLPPSPPRVLRRPGLSSRRERPPFPRSLQGLAWDALPTSGKPDENMRDLFNPTRVGVRNGDCRGAALFGGGHGEDGAHCKVVWSVIATTGASSGELGKRSGDAWTFHGGYNMSSPAACQPATGPGQTWEGEVKEGEDEEEEVGVVQFLAQSKFVLCGRVFVSYTSKDGSAYLVEVNEDHERKSRVGCGDQYRLSLEKLIDVRIQCRAPDTLSRKYSSRLENVH